MIKALKGFADLHYAPVTTDTADAYAPGSYVAMPGAQSLAPSDTRTDYEILADDTTYAQGSDYKSTELNVTVAEMSLKDLGALTGSAFDTASGVLSEKAADTAPCVALSFSALRADGGKRLYKYYAAVLQSYKVSHQTKGQNGNIAAYELTFLAKGRRMDGLVRDTKDGADAADLTFLTSAEA